jgi:hypothetical protein
MKTMKFIAWTLALAFLTNACSKEDSNRRKMAGEYTVEKIEYYTSDASNNAILTHTKTDVGTITLLKTRDFGAGYDFSFELDTIPAGFKKAWVTDDYLGPPISRQWSIDIGNRNLLILHGRNWTQGIEAYANYTVDQKHGKHSTWTFYSFNSSSSSSYGTKEVLYLKKK